MNTSVKRMVAFGGIILVLTISLAVYFFHLPFGEMLKPLVFIHLIFILSAIGLSMVESRDPEKIGFAFMAAFLFKMLLTLVFLWLSLPEGDARKPTALISVGFYFALLLVQVSDLYKRSMK